MAPRKKSRGLLLALSLLILIVIMALIWPREKRLMDRAVLVTNHTDWDDDTGYDWLSDHELAYLRVNRRGRPPTCGVFRYDLKTRIETSLDGLTNQVNRSIAPTTFPVGFLFFSPDNTHVLWFGKENVLYMARLDGSDLQRYPAKVKHADIYNTWILWLEDSRRWAEVTYYRDDDGGTVYLHDIDVPNSAEALRFTPLAPGQSAIFWFFGNSPPGSLHLFGKPFDPDVVTTTEEVDEMDLTVSAQPLHRYRVMFPMPVEVKDIGMSPDGKHIAWTVCATQQPPALLKWLLPHRFEPQTTWAIWVSHMDGSEMREIGDVKTEENTSAASTGTSVKAYERDEISGLGWTPDGKHLSFLYANSLWTVPAE